ncbi:MAG: hypothetical protein KBC30_08085 [Planctomycetes bacterium]|jgi:ribonuclease Z|nr:hypothetical protein [Planctomycetota bacterium]HPY76081.1 MBL fold metallo-hydrolase [Planctomycetota bacterium]HQB01484.1 MBL fold metallo-hydrolase [Planctomycetota bacterium]
MKIQLTPNLSLDGTSIASSHTSIYLQELDTLFDIGIFHKQTISANNILISHAHMDHAGALAHFISQRTLFRMTAPNIYVPSETITPFQTILQAWQQLDNCTYRYNLHAIEQKKYYELKKDYAFMAFPVSHRVPSYGFTIFQVKNKLKPIYLHLPGYEIEKLRKNGIEITNTQYEPLLSYTGDCIFQSYLDTPTFQKSRFLLMECTFLNERKNKQHAQRWGHIHWENIIQHHEILQQHEKIILVHFSPRYSQQYIDKLIETESPPSLRNKIMTLYE